MRPHGVGAAAASGALAGRLVARERLDTHTCARMFQLLGAHFAGVDRGTFDRDLAEKTAVILLEDDAGTLHGFSTLLIYDTVAAGQPLTVVYSGDTIVERPWWGSPALARTWIQSVRAIERRRAIQSFSHSRDLYWLLLTSGFRTYRFLPVFFRTFYPCADAPTPPGAQTMLHAIASERFGASYDAVAGVVRLTRPQVLAGDLLAVPEGREHDPHVRFFLERNPGYVVGDELVCLTRVHDDNLTAAGRRMARQAAGSTS